MGAVDFLWHRLDSPGHDACRFEASARARRWTGMSAFAESDSSAMPATRFHAPLTLSAATRPEPAPSVQPSVP